MSTRKNSTEKSAKKTKEPKVKKVKEPKPKKEKAKKSKGKKGTEESFGEASFEQPKQAPVTRRKAPKAPKDVYTLVLLISFLFFVIATVFLYLDLASYK
jgi:hypothetical protein